MSFLCEEEPPPPHLNSLGSTQATRLPLGAVKLFGMHITPPLTINVGIHFTYPQGDGGLSHPPASLSQEWILNLGPLVGRSTVLPTELSWPITCVGAVDSILTCNSSSLACATSILSIGHSDFWDANSNTTTCQKSSLILYNVKV